MRHLSFVLVILLLPLRVVDAAQAEFPRGSRVGLIPPQGMTASDSIQGFEDPFNQARIVVTEMSARTYPDIEKEFSEASLVSGGMTVEGRETMTIGEAPAFLVVARQTLGWTTLRKWALVVRGRDLTALVIVLVPERAAAAYPDAAVRATLASVIVRGPIPIAEQLALLPYRLGDLGGFQVVRARPDGVALLTFGPDPTATAEEQPFVVIATPGEVPAATGRDAFARRALAAAWDSKDMRNLRAEDLRIRSEPGHQITVETKGSKTGVDLTLVQWLRFAPDRTMQMLGVARTELWPLVFPHMRAVRDGIAAK